MQTFTLTIRTSHEHKVLDFAAAIREAAEAHVNFGGAEIAVGEKLCELANLLDAAVNFDLPAQITL